MQATALQRGAARLARANPAFGCQSPRAWPLHAQAVSAGFARAAVNTGRYLAMACGGVLVLSSAGGASQPWLVLIGLLPLFLSIRFDRPWVAFSSGITWGASASVGVLLAAEAPPSGGSAWFFLLTLAPGFYAYCGARITRLVGFSPFVLGVSWMLLELALTPIGSRHGLLPATQEGGFLMRILGCTFGYVLVAFVVAYVEALLVHALADLYRRVVLEARTWRTRKRPARIPPCIVQEIRSFVLALARPRAPPDNMSPAKSLVIAHPDDFGPIKTAQF